MEFNTESIANYIYDLLKFQKVCNNDLYYALYVFVETEEYEKCSVIKELIDLGYYDNRKRNNSESILKIESVVNSIGTGQFFLEKKEFKKQKESIKKFKEDIEKFYEMMMKNRDNIIIPPFKSERNIKYFLSI